ncbi:gliding motility protein SprC [Flavobacterium poyangense]|uniref:gliding motility protein SprC n=1 Tax=Flavobacterium poyangense TaxID=2204302 RepID=UPI001420AA99|nr:gliding motility protein SprC [Flavobacterium sp. JXAS1]
MIQKTTLIITKFFLLFGMLFYAKSGLYAQTKVVNPQILSFDRICAGTVHNEYNATFTYSGFPAGTEFTVELSTDNFVTVIPANTILPILNDAPNQKTIKFAVPSTLKGSDTYSLRVSTAGFSSGKFTSFDHKTAFPIYFKAHDNQYTINDFKGTATFCSGGSYLLTIDADRADPANDSPLKYNFLTYNWYKDNGVSVPPTLVAAATGPSYSVTAEGVYYVETNYGTCSSESYSNRVTVSSSGSGSAVTVTSSLGNPFCASGAGTVLTATSGNSYVWSKDGKVLAGQTARFINANESGVYSVAVDFGGCVANGSINLKSNSFDASIDVADVYKLKEGETLKVSITSDATNPTYEWYLNNNLIAGATTDTYQIAVRGNYRAKISQSSGCISSKEFAFRITSDLDPKTELISNIVKLGGNSPYWNIPDIYKTPNTKITILSSNGEVMFDDVGSNYDPELNSFIKDFKNVNPVYYYVIKSDTGEKKGSITVIK